MTDKYWVGDVDSVWATTNNWSLTDGGTGDTTAPATTDNAFFTVNSTVTCGWSNEDDCLDLDFTGHTGALTPTDYSALDVYGSLTLATGTTWTNTLADIFFKGTGSETITNNGATARCDYQFHGTGTYTMQDAVSLGLTNALAHYDGTLDLAGFSGTSDSFASSTANTRTLDMDNVAWTSLNQGGSYGFQFNNSTGLTLSCTDATHVQANGNTQVDLGDHDWDALGFISLQITTYYGSGCALRQQVGGLMSKIIFYGDFTETLGMKLMTDVKTVDWHCEASGSKIHTMRFTAGVTLTVTNSFTMTGFDGTFGLEIESLTGGTEGYVDFDGAGDVDLDFIKVTDNHATPATTWYVGAGGSIVSNGDGWETGAAPVGGVTNRLLLINQPKFNNGFRSNL
jgi:hypothetical protein